jgi:TrpR-related protein YerC/YecD
MESKFIIEKNRAKEELFELFLLLKSKAEVARFMRDLCTPQEIEAMADRWQICKKIVEGELSYREINEATGASLATITRVARFVKDEPHQGYTMMLKRCVKNKK